MTMKAARSASGSRKIQHGNSSNMLQGSAQDNYQSRYNANKPKATPAVGMSKSNPSDGTMSQINRMTRGSY